MECRENWIITDARVGWCVVCEDRVLPHETVRWDAGMFGGKMLHMECQKGPRDANPGYAG